MSRPRTQPRPVPEATRGASHSQSTKPAPADGSRRSVWAALKAIGREAMRDDITGEAAKAAYYFFLSFFPAILALFAFTGILGGQEAFDAIMRYLHNAMPGQAASYLEQFVREITGAQRPGMLSLGLLLTLWSASNIFAVLAEGLNVMYDLEEDRSWWKRRAMAIVATVAGLALFVSGAAAILAGPSLVDFLSLSRVWNVLRWPLAFLLVTAMIWLIYYLMPNRDQAGSKKPTLIGALVGCSLWTVATLGFRLYVSHFGTYSKTYGVVGGVLVLLLWLYLTALAILFGGEVAATLEQRETQGWNIGSAPGNRHRK